MPLARASSRLRPLDPFLAATNLPIIRHRLRKLPSTTSTFSATAILSSHSAMNRTIGRHTPSAPRRNPANTGTPTARRGAANDVWPVRARRALFHCPPALCRSVGLEDERVPAAELRTESAPISVGYWTRSLLAPGLRRVLVNLAHWRRRIEPGGSDGGRSRPRMRHNFQCIRHNLDPVRNDAKPGRGCQARTKRSG
jgi:hypothetical protein